MTVIREREIFLTAHIVLGMNFQAWFSGLYIYISGVRTLVQKVKPKMTESEAKDDEIDVQCQSVLLFLSARSTQIDVQCQSFSVIFSCFDVDLKKNTLVL